MSVKVSVVIPVYNPGEYFVPCIESVIAQTIFDSMEILLIDDGSTDGSAEICDDFADRYPNILAVHQKNSGVSVARNTGLEKAVGEFVGFVDSDDLIEPQMYEKLYSAAKETGADIAFCSIRHPLPDKEVVIDYPFEKNVLIDREKIRTEVVDFLINYSLLNSLCNKIFSLETVKDLRLTVGRKYGEDREFFIKALTNSNGVCCIPYIGYCYRLVETGAIQKPRSDYGDNILQQYKNDLELFEKLGVDNKTFLDKCAGSVSSSIVAALSLTNDRFKGKYRRLALSNLVNDEQLQALLDDIWHRVPEYQARYSVMLLCQMRRRSVTGIRAVINAMKIKVAAVRIIKRH